MAATQIYNSAVLEDSAVVSTQPAELIGLSCINTDAGIVYLMVFDAASLPANGTVPKWRAPIAAADNKVVDFANLAAARESDAEHFKFATGLVVAISSTAATLTVKTDDEATFDVAFHH